MPFLGKIADITMSGRHVGNMSATFPAKVQVLPVVRRCELGIASIIMMAAKSILNLHVIILVNPASGVRTDHVLDRKWHPPVFLSSFLVSTCLSVLAGK
jgi:hypothetical protein